MYFAKMFMASFKSAIRIGIIYVVKIFSINLILKYLGNSAANFSGVNNIAYFLAQQV